jgi:endonuclease/exonuclease/phosphatase family metal-dependent hydrolase
MWHKNSIWILWFFLCKISFLQAQNIKVITYNIRLDASVDGVNQWDKRKHKVYAIIKEQSPDILCIQEGLPNQVKDLAQQFTAYFYVGVGREDGVDKGEYSAIFLLKKKFELITSQTFWLSPTPTVAGSIGWDAAITRICTYAKVRHKTSKKELFVFNTHFDHVGELARTESANLILQKMQELAAESPQILCGDFNSEPNAGAYQKIANSKEPLLTESSTQMPHAKNCTFTGFAVNGNICKQIDYVFYTKQFELKQNQIITQNDGQYYPSDHLPVITILKLKE